MAPEKYSLILFLALSSMFDTYPVKKYNYEIMNNFNITKLIDAVVYQYKYKYDIKHI